MSEVTIYRDTDNQILPRTPADDAAEMRVDEIPQERFDAFAPQHSIEYEHSMSRVAKQTGVRTMHFVEVSTGGRGAHSPSSHKRRVEERAAVGLDPSIWT